MKVMGVDPGFAACGWAVLDLGMDSVKLLDAGVICTKKSTLKRGVLASDDNLVRARDIYKQLDALREAYDVRVFVAEAMSSPRNASSAAKVAMVWGILAAITERHNLPIVQASPKEVKKLTVGKTSASKDEVGEFVTNRFSELNAVLSDLAPSLREHAHDATAVVLACLGSEVLRMARG